MSDPCTSRRYEYPTLANYEHLPAELGACQICLFIANYIDYCDRDPHDTPVAIIFGHFDLYCRTTSTFELERMYDQEEFLLI